MAEKLFEITGLSVRYETDDATVYAVNDLYLSLNKGETLGLVGETGAGKTTTALSIMRLLPDKIGKTTAGKIMLDGVDILAATENDMRLIRSNVVSMIFQDPMSSLNPILTVGDQIDEVLLLHNAMTPQERSDRVDEILDMVGLSPDRKNDYPHQFSGGMKQRIVIAIALACKPKLLLADEPTTALDVTIQAQVLKMMKELKDKLGTAMLLITHDLGVVAQTCDRVAIMYAGEIIEIGTVQDIFLSLRRHPYADGLFGSIPNLKVATERLNPIEGLMPDPTNPPSGCKFHERCPQCMPRCVTDIPPVTIDGSHSIKCHLFAQGGKGK